MQKKNYKLAALDMDGTLLGSDHRISDYTKQVLARADAEGKILTLATGRALSELRGIVDDIPALRYAICQNGAVIYDLHTRESIHRSLIPQADVEFALNALEKYTSIPQMYIQDQTYLRATKDVDLNPYRLEYFRSVWEAGSIFEPELIERYHATHPPVDKMDIYFTSEADLEAYRAEISQRNIDIVGSIAIGLEISAKGVNKASSLVKLCEILNVSLEDTIAVGDSDNDRQILATAGFSIAMGNANDDVKQIADTVTDDCDHDGAAKALEEYLL